jgi:hypothetical protein
MSKLEKVEVVEVYSKPVVYKGCMNDKCKKGRNKDGSPKCECGLGYIDRSFDAFSIKADDENYYQLRGWSTNKVKAGDTIHGEIVERPYKNKDGEDKVAYDFNIAKPEDQAKAENEELKAEIARMKAENDKSKIETDDEIIPF